MSEPTLEKRPLDNQFKKRYKDGKYELVSICKVEVIEILRILKGAQKKLQKFIK